MTSGPAPDPASLAATAIRTTIVLLVLIVGIRVSGKRRIGELNLYDLLLVLLVANGVQNAMTSADAHLTVSLVVASTLLLIGWLCAKAMSRWPTLERRLLGTPTVIVRDGHLIQHNMKREGVTEEEVMASVRDQGLDDVSDVELAVMELDGFLSVVPKQHDRDE